MTYQTNCVLIASCAVVRLLFLTFVPPKLLNMFKIDARVKYARLVNHLPLLGEKVELRFDVFLVFYASLLTGRSHLII
jgi:hypothetical protein